MSTGWLFRASWPILLPHFPLSMLKVEACQEVDDLAREAGCRIVGDLSWTVIETHLIAQAPAVPLTAARASRPRFRAPGIHRSGRPVAAPDVDSVRDVLAGRTVPLDPASLAVVLERLDNGSRSAEELARRVGCSQRTVQRHRAQRREQQQRKGQAA